MELQEQFCRNCGEELLNAAEYCCTACGALNPNFNAGVFYEDRGMSLWEAQEDCRNGHIVLIRGIKLQQWSSATLYCELCGALIEIEIIVHIGNSQHLVQ